MLSKGGFEPFRVSRRAVECRGLKSPMPSKAPWLVLNPNPLAALDCTVGWELTMPGWLHAPIHEVEPRSQPSLASGMVSELPNWSEMVWDLQIWAVVVFNLDFFGWADLYFVGLQLNPNWAKFCWLAYPYPSVPGLMHLDSFSTVPAQPFKVSCQKT